MISRVLCNLNVYQLFSFIYSEKLQKRPTGLGLAGFVPAKESSQRIAAIHGNSGFHGIRGGLDSIESGKLFILCSTYLFFMIVWKMVLPTNVILFYLLCTKNRKGIPTSLKTLKDAN